jgi:hypothetical protein
MTPFDMNMSVANNTKPKSIFFNSSEDSSLSFTFIDLSSSGVGSLSRKLDILFSEFTCWFGMRLTFAFLQIKEYKANIPPADS